MLFLLLAAAYAILLPLGSSIWLLRIIRKCLRLAKEEQAKVAALTTWLGGLLLLEVWSLVGPWLVRNMVISG